MAMKDSLRVMLLAGLCFGCGGGDSGSVDAARDDGEAEEWTLEATPLLHAGEGLDGDPDLQFGYIEGVYRLPDGSIAVMDAWTSSLSFLSASGELLGRVGREGRGPGEFPPMVTLRSFSCGTDSVYVQAPPNIQVFVPPGEYVRSFAMDRIAWVEACSGGSILARASYGHRRQEAGMFTDSMVLLRYDLDGELEEVFDTIAKDERAYMVGGEGIGNARRIFGNEFSIDGNSSGFVVGYSGAPELELYDPAAEPFAVITASGWQREVTGEDIEAFRDFTQPEEMNAIGRRSVEDRLQAAPGRFLPAWGELKLGPAGNVWIRQYDFLDAVSFYDRSSLISTRPQPRLDGARAWKVVNPAGELIAELKTPPGFQLHEIGSDWILGIWKDEFDVQYVQMYQLTKSQ